MINKQELIETLEEQVNCYRGCLPKKDYTKGRHAVLKDVLTIAKLLDEPQKPKTEVFNHDEKFVVEWLDHTTGYHYSLYNAINDAGSEFRSWMKIGFNSNRFARAFMSMDYEVEKEPLYTVTLNLDLKYYLVIDENECDEISPTLTTSSDVLGYRYYLTEKEIKSADTNLWPFAVPVEEEDK